MLLMKNECTEVSSIKLKLTFDDGSYKERTISTNDLIEAEYNANGLRKKITGKVVKVSTVGTDPNGWYIIVDGSDDFDSAKARFSPMSVIDIEIIRKAEALDTIQTPIDNTGIPYLRVIHGYLQYSRDGIKWYRVRSYHHHHPIKPAVNPDELPPMSDNSDENTDGFEDSGFENDDADFECGIVDTNY